MIRSDEKLLAMKALKAKLRKLMLGASTDEETDAEKMMGEEIGTNNNVEDAREMAAVEDAVDGEDGEKEISIEIEAEGEGPGMTDLYDRMKAEFGGMPESRKAAGLKKGLMGGGGMGKMMKARGKRG